MIAESPETAEIIERLLELADSQLPAAQRPLASRFLRSYYRGAAADDLRTRTDSDLLGAAIAHFRLAAARPAGRQLLHVYNPQIEQHGWHSSHTIIEIVTDDLPFLVDSVRMCTARRGLTNHLIIHPILHAQRDASGQLTGLSDDGDGDGVSTEAVMHFEIDRMTEADALDELRGDIARVLAEVQRVVEDWGDMRERLATVADGLERQAVPVADDEKAKAVEFLRWLGDSHFTFLGYRSYDLVGPEGQESLQAQAGSGLGILRSDTAGPSQGFAALPPEIRALAREPQLLIVTKANQRATVHRPVYIDYVGIKRFDAAGRVCGEQRFLGLFSSAAYNRNTRDIPLLRDKVAYVERRAGFAENSHANRALLNILESFPRDELFQVTEEELYQTALGIVHLQERQKVRLFLRRDPFNRFYSCIVFVPRDRFRTEVRMQIVAILEQMLHGHSQDFSVQISESVLARIHIIIRIGPAQSDAPDLEAIEQQIVLATRDWRDELHDALLEQHGEEHGTRLYRHYQDTFRADYRERYPAQVAVLDIDKIEALRGTGELGMTLYRPLESPTSELRFKLFHPQSPIPLSDVLPMLEHLGVRVVDEDPSRLRLQGDESVWIHDFGLQLRDDVLDIEHIAGKFQEAFARVWQGAAESDGFNRLVLRAQIGWREVVVLRAYCNYLRQVQATFSHEYMAHALDANPAIARSLVELFHTRLDPDHPGDRAADEIALCGAIEGALDAVTSLDEDRILRGFYLAIRATLRTNHYRTGRDGAPAGHLSFKLESAKVPGMPEPAPLYEIFVYSPQVEGIHLRGGKVARGGLRWSDRREDFRTEILGLVKAQMVKNAVIVPVGSKGGFVCKRLPGDPSAVQAEVQACYRTFIRGLLDLTDNLREGVIDPPPRVLRHDGDDPYLVVAADKGTATFSDIANEISAEYGFWLGDAFASGGSAGYDHKAMGITARGGWESVKRHFRQLGVDTQRDPFTVVGIGGMAGDVFGNGMLLSEQIRLVAAFNHVHIFIDPDPDPAVSFAERKRLFELRGSGWNDYDAKLISAGGGVWSRDSKSIRLSPEARAAIGVEQETFAPNELIHHLLRAPVDLIWNGGIGTYVKAAAESHAEVGDRANDALRVDAAQLRCKVVGEGGNLGMTQRGRVEFAQHGGYLYTDAIDNSAGVDCSDHEVNIKILLRDAIDRGDLTLAQRDRLLREMTDEVAALVLHNNVQQTLVLSLASVQSHSMAGVHARLMDQLGARGRLSRTIERLPSNAQLQERRAAGGGLTQPELAVLLAYVKIDLYESLLASTLPEDPGVQSVLADYFPTPLRERFADAIGRHRLRREIIATQLANEVVNKAGLTFIHRVTEESGASADTVTRAWLVARRAGGADELAERILGLDARVSGGLQSEMLLEQRKQVERATRWLLRNHPAPIDIDATVTRYREGLTLLGAEAEELAGRIVTRHPMRNAMRKGGVPARVVRQVCSLAAQVAGYDIIEAARVDNLPVQSAGLAYFRIGERLGLNWLRDRVETLPRNDRWETLARSALRDDLASQQRMLTSDVLSKKFVPSRSNRSIEAWIAGNADQLARFQHLLDELRSGVKTDFAMLSVAMRELRALHPKTGG